MDLCSDDEDTAALLSLEEVYPRTAIKSSPTGDAAFRRRIAAFLFCATGVAVFAIQPAARRSASKGLIGGASGRVSAKQREVAELQARLDAAKTDLISLQSVLPVGAAVGIGLFPPAEQDSVQLALASVPWDAADPIWGCGLLGRIPGISQDGSVAPETQRMISSLQKSSSLNKVTFWNWNLAPQTDGSDSSGRPHTEHLSKDFIFVPEQWGAGAVEERYLRPAGQANFMDSNGRTSPAQMADVLLGMNEPDISGSCMGNMFGKCTKACSDGDCPAAYLDKTLPPASPNAQGECNCWQYSHATGVGFWPLSGCNGDQPLPRLWEDEACVETVMESWRQTAAIAASKGYKYLSTPLLAVDIEYGRKFIEKACGCVNGQCSCTEAACGCPVYVAFHFYAYDCRPQETNGYADFQRKLDGVRAIMEQYDFVRGAIINEIGMLNCAPVSEDPICVPNSGRYPASQGPDNSCPVNDELPNGMGTFIEQIFELVSAAKTSTGKRIVKGASWFNADMDGGTYNLELFNPDGSINPAGESYIKGCNKWAEAIVADR